MPLPDVMYCAEQIKIPPELPIILKTFTKAAIRTQPENVLLWSATFFDALSKGQRLPAKVRFEMKVDPLRPDILFCASQIKTPPELPDILSNYAREVLRTQPANILLWSAAYFHTQCKEKGLPIEDCLKMNAATQKTDIGLTPGLLRTLHKQLSQNATCSKEELQRKWRALCLPADKLETLLSLGSFSSEVDRMEFLALGCTALGGTLMSSLKSACEILTEDEADGAARIPFATFRKIYTYLAHLDGDVKQDQIDDFLSSLQPQVDKQNGMIQVSDFFKN